MAPRSCASGNRLKRSTFPLSGMMVSASCRPADLASALWCDRPGIRAPGARECGEADPKTMG
jgi:hypothetical protein